MCPSLDILLESQEIQRIRRKWESLWRIFPGGLRFWGIFHEAFIFIAMPVVDVDDRLIPL
jgi:hypothetical protein